MTHDELVEKVARAIHASRDGLIGGASYAKYRSDRRIGEAYRRDAVAAIAVIHEVMDDARPEMVNAGAKALLGVCETRFAGVVADDVIEAALAASPLGKEG